MHKSIEPFYSQVDTEKLRKAIKYVGEMGNGTRVFYTQKVAHPHEQEIYISIGMKRDTWSFTAHEYGHRYFPQMHQAISMVASEIITRTATKEDPTVKIGDAVLTETQMMALRTAMNFFVIDLKGGQIKDESLSKQYTARIKEIWELMVPSD